MHTRIYTRIHNTQAQSTGYATIGRSHAYQTIIHKERKLNQILANSHHTTVQLSPGQRRAVQSSVSARLLSTRSAECCAKSAEACAIPMRHRILRSSLKKSCFEAMRCALSSSSRASSNLFCRALSFASCDAMRCVAIATNKQLR